MTIIFEDYDNNICFNNFSLFLRTKYQHRSKSKYYDQIMNHTML